MRIVLPYLKVPYIIVIVVPIGYLHFAIPDGPLPTDPWWYSFEQELELDRLTTMVRVRGIFPVGLLIMIEISTWPWICAKCE